MLDFQEMPVATVRDLKKLLTEWKLENILSHLTAQEVDVEILEMMKLSHIRLLLHSFPVGIQIRFEYNLEQWRSDIGKPLQVHAIDDRNQICLKEQQENTIRTTNCTKSKTKFLGVSKTVQTEFQTNFNTTQTNKINNNVLASTHQGSNSNRTTPLNSATLTQSAKSQHSINLQEILLHNHPDGSEIIDDYHINKKFSHPERQRLINTIVNYYLENYIDFNLQTSYDLENAILEMFPNERLDMYRNTKHGKLYLKYIAEKSVFYTKQRRLKTEERNDPKDEQYQGDANDSSLTGSFSEDALRLDAVSSNHYENQFKLKRNDADVRETADCNDKTDIIPVRDVKSTHEVVTEILLQTVHNDCKKFVKIFKPFSYHDFMSTASAIFCIPSVDDYYVMVNECEISENDFENVILQYYKLTTFTVELRKKAVDIPPMHLTKVEHLENSCSPPTTFDHPNSFMNTSLDNGTVQIIYNHLPDANDIRNIPSLLPIVKIADNGRALENKHRTSLAKAIIDECLNFQPERVLKRQDFLTLSQNLVHAFPNEVASAYFIPSQPNHAARGKLWNAYNNKRNFYGSSGIVQRRHHNIKRKHLSDQDDKSEQTSDKVFIANDMVENVEFSQNSALDWNILKQKWSDSHRNRRDELIRHKMSAQDYMQKYSILRGVQGIDLMETDVNILYPTVTNVSNWLSLYNKVVDKARKMRKFEMVTKIIAAIDNSNDEKYRASLALLLISYIFPYNAKLNDNGDRASKSEIQERFIKEYKSMEDLESDIACADLKIRFVHQSQKIIYAEFSIGGFLFKCVDLLEALSSIFHYIMAMNVEYPKMCWHIWQFVQLAIFQIEIQDYILPNVESTINDLFMTH